MGALVYAVCCLAAFLWNRAGPGFSRADKEAALDTAILLSLIGIGALTIVLVCFP